MSLDPRNHTYARQPRTPDLDSFSFARPEGHHHSSLDNGLDGSIPGTPVTPIEVDDANSIYTLEDDDDGERDDDNNTLYDLPTHISSHGEVSDIPSSPHTLPPSRVSSPFRERATHPLRALTATNLVLNQQNGTDESLISSSPVVLSALRQEAVSNDIQEGRLVYDVEDDGRDEDDGIPNVADTTASASKRAEEWAERGAATAVKRVTNDQGNEEDVIIRKSVKDFKFGRTLGIGSYSTVILATDKKTQRQFAVKVLDKRHIIREKKVKYVNIEKNTLSRLGERNGIIHMFFTFQDESSLYFVLDYAPNGELLALIKEHGTLNEETTRYYGAQLLDAIKYMHDNGVIHRDLKPENILLDAKMKLQITDFGTAKLLEADENGRYPVDTRSKSFVGTAEYVSPELLNEKAVGKPCDIWAFGCIVYQMIAGRPPFKATNEYLTFQKIVKLQYAFTAGFPMAVRDLIKKILVLNPKDRITIRGIQAHYFFQEVDFKNAQSAVWDASPPIPGPYKVTANSMLPIPQLSNSSSRTKITIPRRSVSTPNTPTQIDNKSTDSLPSTPASATIIAPRESQQVLMRAKANVAARKQKESMGNSAAGAAFIALSRQPNDIIKAFNDQKKERSFTEVDSPPVTASSNIERQQITSGSTTGATTTTDIVSPSSPHLAQQAVVHPITTLRKKPPKLSTPKSSVTPMTKLDLEFVDFLKDSEERVIRKGEINVYLTSVDNVEKKYKKRLVDAPLGGNKSGSSSSSILSQVANGSYRGLRNMAQHGEEAERSIITNHKDSDDLRTESARAKLKKFFSSNSSEEEKKNRILVVTSNARALLLHKLDVDEEGGQPLELRTEISLTHPVIKVRELLPTTAVQDSPSLFVIESYNSAFVFESVQSDVSAWTQAIHAARLAAHEKEAQKHLEQDPSGDAGTVLGSEAAKSAAAIVTSPTLKSTEFSTSKSRAISTSTTSSSSSSMKQHSNHHSNHMLKDLVQRKSARGTPKEIPDQGRLYHGLPMTLLNQTPREHSKNPLIAAAEAAIGSNSAHAKKLAKDPQSSTMSITANANAVPKQITGMNSRLLARSVRSSKPKK